MLLTIIVLLLEILLLACFAFLLYQILWIAIVTIGAARDFETLYTDDY